MRNRLLALTAALGIAALASWTPSAEATIYCSASYCAAKPEGAACSCPPGTDKEGNRATAKYGTRSAPTAAGTSRPGGQP